MYIERTFRTHQLSCKDHSLLEKLDIAIQVKDIRVRQVGIGRRRNRCCAGFVRPEHVVRRERRVDINEVEQPVTIPQHALKHFEIVAKYQPILH